jgi:transposase
MRIYAVKDLRMELAAAKFDFDGLPLAFDLTGGEASDSRHFEMLLDIGPDIAPRAMLADNGYRHQGHRQAARRRGSCPAIPYRDGTARPKFFPKTLFLQRACPCRAGGRQTQALQAHRFALREDGTELRRLRLARPHLYLGQNGLV